MAKRQYTIEEEKSIQIAETIRKQLLGTGTVKVWSWGANTWRAIQNGLTFKVQGFKFRGDIQIILMPSDTYTIRLVLKNEIHKEFEGVHFDEMVDLIDVEVEFTGENYEDDINNATYKL
jgi:hypothetical protein